MKKKKDKINLIEKERELSHYAIVPDQKNDNIYYINYTKTNPEVLLTTLHKEEDGRIIITLSLKFEDWFFNEKEKEDLEDYLFSVSMAENMLKAK